MELFCWNVSHVVAVVELLVRRQDEDASSTSHGEGKETCYYEGNEHERR
jgi:hypothetical protein